MEAADLNVVRACQRWLAANWEVMLVTVVQTWGSSPRPPGSMMAIRNDGAVIGSVSGGCIEEDLIAEIRANGAREIFEKPSARVYGVDAEQARRVGLPCGGTLELVLEPLTAASRVDELSSGLAHRRQLVRTLDMRTGFVDLTDGEADVGVRFDGHQLVHGMGARYRLLVVGAGQLSRYLCEVAVGAGFDVVVCDPREEFQADWNIPGVSITSTMPDDMVLFAVPDARTAVITLTHDPKLDDLALMEALRSPAFYVGALGSRRNNAARLTRMAEHFGMSQGELGKLRGPAGIYIGSRTPPEIAISIMAEIIAVKNGVMLPVEASIAMGKELSTTEAICLR